MQCQKYTSGRHVYRCDRDAVEGEKYCTRHLGAAKAAKTKRAKADQKFLNEYDRSEQAHQRANELIARINNIIDNPVATPHYVKSYRAGDYHGYSGSVTIAGDTLRQLLDLAAKGLSRS